MSKVPKNFRQTIDAKLASEILNHSEKPIATLDPAHTASEVLGERLKLVWDAGVAP